MVLFVKNGMFLVHVIAMTKSPYVLKKLLDLFGAHYMYCIEDCGRYLSHAFNMER
jgi:hypothetical protein